MGARSGWLYKTGGSGLGYYRDGVPEKQPLCLSELVRPLADVDKLKLSLDKLLVRTTTETILGDPLQAEMGDQPPTTTKKSEKKKDRAEVARSQGEQAFELFAKGLTVHLKDDSHRELGHWAFDSANANAWPGASEFLSSTAADFIALQETKVAAEGIEDSEAAVRSKGWKVSIAACVSGDGGGKSAGVAVGCRAHVGLANSIDESSLPEELKGRFWTKHLGAVCKGGVHYCSGYLHSAIGVQHRLNLDYLQAVAAVIDTIRGPWIFAADFNCTPTQLSETGWLRMVGGVIVAPKFATCNARTIDFSSSPNRWRPQLLE